MVRALLIPLLFFISLFALPVSAHEGHDDNGPIWHQVDDNGKPVVKLYFFWSKTCPTAPKHTRLSTPYPRSTHGFRLSPI